MVVSNTIDLVDAEVGKRWFALIQSKNTEKSAVGLDIKMADSTFLTHGRTRVQRNEGVEIIVTVKNERNLASLTVYGDIEGQEPTNSNSSSNEIYITAGVVRILFFSIDSRRFVFAFRWISRGKMKVQKKFNFVPITVEW